MHPGFVFLNVPSLPSAAVDVEQKKKKKKNVAKRVPGTGSALNISPIHTPPPAPVPLPSKK